MKTSTPRLRRTSATNPIPSMGFIRLYSNLTLLYLISMHIRPFAGQVTVTVTAAAACFTPTGPEYYLKTHVTDGGNSSKDGLYLASYHTGAAENDAVLVPPTGHALAKGFMDGSYQVRPPSLTSAGAWSLGLM